MKQSSLLLTILLGPAVALAQTPAEPPQVKPTLAPTTPPSRPAATTIPSPEIARLQSEVASQRLVISNLIRIIQQRLSSEQAALDALQATLQNRTGTTDTVPNVLADSKVPVVKTPRVAANTGVVTGTVKVRSNDAAWVYLADTPSNGGSHTSMSQVDKAFVPGAIVVAKGSRVDFPNSDPIFHNIFSDTPGNSFDLGSYPQGESRTLTMTQIGQVDVLCNLHSSMRGYVFVVPNSHFVKVGRNGKYTLSKLPTGKHRIGVWTPNAAPVIKETRIDAGNSAVIDFEITAGPPVRHLRKDGTPYGSYDE
jgi:plastocyanin